MSTKIERIPNDMMEALRESNATLPGKCFENCVIAVLGLRASRKLRYVLGFVTPPGYSPIPHAWLGQETPSGFIYLDPTLQFSSALWQERKDEFIYQERYAFNKEQLLLWFQANYPERELDETGVPMGLLMGPTLNANGKLTQQPPP